MPEASTGFGAAARASTTVCVCRRAQIRPSAVLISARCMDGPCPSVCKACSAFDGRAILDIMANEWDGGFIALRNSGYGEFVGNFSSIAFGEFITEPCLKSAMTVRQAV